MKSFKNILILALINTTKQEQVDTSNDSIIIVDCIEKIPGGKTIDTSAVLSGDVISSGHVVIEETATGLCKALGVDVNGAYVALPANHTYKGIVVATVLKEKPFVAIMVRGSMNDEAFKNSTGLITPAGAKTNLPLIRFTKD